VHRGGRCREHIIWHIEFEAAKGVETAARD
jgi:hypothetical protein